MTIKTFISQFENNPLLAKNVAFYQDLPEKPMKEQPFPDWLISKLEFSLQKNNIHSLYTHQRQAVDLVQDGKNIVISTGTASGKSLCYQIPILNRMIEESHSTSLLFFPTKALANDQQRSFFQMAQDCDCLSDQFLISVYDGDTPSSHRNMIRQKSRILLSNPDMLNIGILPHHTNWLQFFENLKFVVIDEIHLYRGVFGSHIANLIRRLKRICQFYGSRPQFIMTSATIANPVEHAKHLIEEEVFEVFEDGSPKGKKTFIIYNPPLINEELGIREGVLTSATKISSLLLHHETQSLVFCETRKFVELVLREIQSVNPSISHFIRGYRSGYLKKDRREIEENLKNGFLRLVVATNALELGVDIGGIDGILMAGYPGSISSLRQRMGRSGRAFNPSVSILITSMNPLDQFMARNPQYLLNQSLEKALINANNPMILLPHIKSAAFELPFSTNDSFGALQWSELQEYLSYLCSEGVIQEKRNKFFWLSDSYPSSNYSLRSTISDQVIIQVDDNENRMTIGEIDFNSSLWMVHPGAVYLHDGENYLVKDLDLEKNIATVTKNYGDYLTEPLMEQEIEIISQDKCIQKENYSLTFGEIEVSSKISGFRKIHINSREVLGVEQLQLPELKLQTVGLFLKLEQRCVAEMRDSKLWLSDANDYGPNWNQIRLVVRKRDQYVCQVCGKREDTVSFHVHHKIPFKCFTNLEKANEVSNLITLCPICHRLAELNIRMRSALSGLKYIMSHMAPLLVLCEPTDMGSFVDPIAKFADQQPVILLYDAVPAGIGLTGALFEQLDYLLQKCLDLVSGCECQNGCPSCVGPVSELGTGGKKETIYLINLLLNREQR